MVAMQDDTATKWLDSLHQNTFESCFATRVKSTKVENQLRGMLVI